MTTSEGGPRVLVEQRGPHLWAVWVACGLTRFEGEFGTFAWTERRAIRKGARLLREFEARRPRNRTDVTHEARRLNGGDS